MTAIRHQKETGSYAAYAKQYTVVILPTGEELGVAIEGHTTEEYAEEIEQIIRPWEKAAVIERARRNEIESKLRLRGENIQWDSYDIFFYPEEVADEERRRLAWELVKQWATRSRIPGREGIRMATLQDWHVDGATPHLRVEVHKLIWTDETLKRTQLMAPHDNSQRNADRLALDKLLQANGFSPLVVLAPGYAEPTPEAVSGPRPAAPPRPLPEPPVAGQEPPRRPYTLQPPRPDPDRAALVAAEQYLRDREEDFRRQREQLAQGLAALEQRDRARLEAEQLRGEVHDMRIRLSRLEQERERWEEDRDRMNARTGEFADLIMAQQAAFEEQAQQLQGTRRELDTWQSNFASVAEELTDVTHLKVTLESEVDIEQQAHANTQAALEQTRRQAQTLEQTLAAERQAHSQRTQALEEALTTEQQAHQETRSALESATQQIQTSEATLAAEQQAHQQTRTALDTALQRIQTLEANLKKQTHDLTTAQRQVTRTRHELETKGQRITALEKEIAQLRQENDTLVATQERLQTRIQDLMEAHRRDIEYMRKDLEAGFKAAVAELRNQLLRDREHTRDSEEPKPE